MTQIQFGEYIFGKNPAKILVQNTCKIWKQDFPNGVSQVKILGLQPRTVYMQGELFAPDREQAEQMYRALYQLYLQQKPKLLTVPGQEAFLAWFTKLELTAQGDGRVLEYTAEFIEVK